MKKTFFNKQQIVSATATDKKLDNRAIWLEEEKPSFWRDLLGTRIKKSGLYFNRDKTLYTGFIDFDTLSHQFIVEDNKLYLKPYVKTTYSDGSSSIQYFYTFEQAEAEATKIAEENFKGVTILETH